MPVLRRNSPDPRECFVRRRLQDHALARGGVLLHRLQRALPRDCTSLDAFYAVAGGGSGSDYFFRRPGIALCPLPKQGDSPGHAGGVGPFRPGPVPIISHLPLAVVAAGKDEKDLYVSGWVLKTRGHGANLAR